MHTQEEHNQAGRPQATRRPAPRDASADADRAAVTGTGTAAGLLALQRTAGNAAVARTVEASRHRHDAGCGHLPAVQRQAAGEELHEHDTACGHVPAVQRQALVHRVIESPGQSMDQALQSEMESRFDGADFSGVRVHTGPLARESAQELGAKAYTTGPNIVVGDSMTKEDWAHELTHYEDQLKGPVPGTDTGAGVSVSDVNDSGERHAVSKARRVMSGPAPQVQRQPASTGSSAVPAPVPEGPGPVAVQRVLSPGFVQGVSERLGIEEGTVKLVKVPNGIPASRRFRDYEEGYVVGLTGAELDESVQSLNNYEDGNTPASVVVEQAGGGGYLRESGIILVNADPPAKFTFDQVVQHEMGHLRQAQAGFDIDMAGAKRALVEYHNILVNENLFADEMRLEYTDADNSLSSRAREQAEANEETRPFTPLGNPWRSMTRYVAAHGGASQQNLLRAIEAELSDPKYDERTGKGRFALSLRDKLQRRVGNMYWNHMFPTG
ncbi:eCIS core domain-containing protein [Streptomyces sp. 900105755]|uniref:eCIS core domain-containing protein n=1 Tax=Streptomyces sp. NPDC001507 TaxID=3364579 RepID=UPI0036B7798F